MLKILPKLSRQTTQFREAAEINIDTYPTVDTLDAWKVSTAKKFQAASGRPDLEPWHFIARASEDSVSFSDLADVPRKLRTLDQKLSAGLQATFKAGGQSGALKDKVTKMETERVETGGSPP